MIKVLYTGGTFDLFHVGHINFLYHCKKISDKVVVSLNTDEFIEEFKGKNPIISYADRKKVLLSCRYVDEVIENVGGKDSKISINLINPTYIAIGDDWARKDYYGQMGFTQTWLDERDITLLYIPYTQSTSTTQIKKNVVENYG